MALDDNSNTNSNTGSNGSSTAHGMHDSGFGSGNSSPELELRERLENLPQELYNYIYDLTFTAEAKIRIYTYDEDRGRVPAQLRDAMKHYSKRVVTVHERPPHLLHVDRASRQNFAKSFYGNPDSIFIFSVGCSFPARDNPFISLMKDVRLVLWCNSTVPSRYGRKRIAKWAGISTESIGLIFYKDIPALVKKRIGGVEKAVEKSAAEVIDLTI
ncbi:hypothetical protein CB0940_06720 [Cercospora beticola]|uniref:Uncharacterized protein n=1 Tax=Cercospora beticola TaxID=122368 RepID=A0A2G5H9Q2_CERBT|nr:hypothetical protein CB0940_06720 [Cercospora beticola]PIA89260.1 hypothetical protein CB0940_06720 [Cercospora beticola]WPB02620.1 hypothetical protein RHO25_007256 [Cercospora beticola]